MGKEVDTKAFASGRGFPASDTVAKKETSSVGASIVVLLVVVVVVVEAADCSSFCDVDDSAAHTIIVVFRIVVRFVIFENNL